MPYADSSGVRLYYEEAGAGPAIILVHELASDLRQWSQQVAHLSARFRCVAYNARGYPPSDVPDEDEAYRYDRFVGDIGAVRESLNLPEVYLVGWSMGAYAALLYTLQHPDRVRGLVMSGVGSGSPAAETDAFRSDMRALAACFETQGAAAGAERIGDAANRQALKRNRPEAWDAFLADLSGHSAPGMARVCRNYQGLRPSLFDQAEAVSRCQVPALVIVGDEDGPCLETSGWLAQTMPQARLSTFAGTGHSPNLEHPDRFNREVEAFIGAIAQNS
jgi:pimeloyl-ACP methyl ester carboxylesterase